MALLSKSDLIYQDYHWKAYGDDDPHITGSPDDTLFNRHEGYEMLYMINKLAEIWTIHDKAVGRKIELIIREHLPSYIRAQSGVRVWVAQNLNKL